VDPRFEHPLVGPPEIVGNIAISCSNCYNLMV
jgi:hypothetical protein